MKAAPIAANEQDRLNALATYAILDTIPEEEYDEITRLATEICRTPISLVSFIDENRQWFKSRQRLKIDQTPRDASFCAHAIINPDKILIVPDARQDERFFDNPLVTGFPNIVFYAGVPLVNDEGYALGSLCVIDSRPRTLTENQLLSLKALAKLVATHVELRRTRIELEQIRQTLADVQKAEESYGVL